VKFVNLVVLVVVVQLGAFVEGLVVVAVPVKKIHVSVGVLVFVEAPGYVAETFVDFVEEQTRFVKVALFMDYFLDL